jgi:hypothetical protein
MDSLGFSSREWDKDYGYSGMRYRRDFLGLIWVFLWSDLDYSDLDYSDLDYSDLIIVTLDCRSNPEYRNV